MTALIVTDHDGRRRVVDIDAPARNVLVLSSWDGMKDRGTWTHLWYRREPPHVLDTVPRFHYYATTHEPLKLKGGPNWKGVTVE